MKETTCTKIQILIIILLMVVGSVLPLLQPEKAHAEAAPHAVDTARIDTFVESMLEKLDFPGMAVGIVKGDQIIYTKGYGHSGPDGQPVTPQTPFILGSSSKSFTALAIMQLVEQGKIDLNASVQRYLPEFELEDKEASKTIRVRHLLNHSSGISTFHGRTAFTNTSSTIDELIHGLKNTPLTEPVGTKHQYSNANYDILGGIIQAVSGESYAEYIQDHVYSPLDMKNSYTSTPEAKKHGLATGYKSIFGFMAPFEQPDNPSMLASAYLISSAEDMSHYLVAQLNGGKFHDISVAATESVAQMHQPAIKDPATGGEYGMGWEIAHGVVQHAGDVESFHADMKLDGDIGVVVLMNAHDYAVRAFKLGMVADGILAIMHGREPVDDAGSITGTYILIDVISAAVMIMLGVSVFNLFKRKKSFRLTPLRIILFAFCLVLFNVVLPIAVLYGFSHTFAPWSVVFSFLPGLGHLAFVLSILSLVIGAAKLIVLVHNLRLHRMKESGNTM
ncbi:serine hydrolase [Paenibacillus sonchi]|uniref:serine hydrolase n=1 Tax=Paenibacillus sonchi TaxID=373687 RepID=UPI001E33408B|nr:serine hydrolase [Paenibacillus sonchi]MCE3198483.1 serine hydrolase [Paenibacillus sonchi]